MRPHATATMLAGLLLCIRGAAADPAATAGADLAATPGQAFDYGRFGQVSVYRGNALRGAEPRDVVLFLSDDGGRNLDVNAVTQALTASGALVAGIDVGHYLAELGKSPQKCVSPAADFENLNHYLQSKLAFKQYIQPTLVGYGSGATLAYATLGEAPDGLFKGALSIGFCPNLALKKPLCKGSGIEWTQRRGAAGALQGVDFLPVKKLSGKWTALQGGSHELCQAPATQRFIAAVPGGEALELPAARRGDAASRDWLPEYQAAYVRITAPPAAAAPILPAAVADLPLTVVPAQPGSPSPWFGIFLSGDGGWVGLDRGVSEEIARHHIPIVGWDSLKYFWSPRTPQGAAQDLDRVVRHYARAWGRSHVLLIGYSQGADTMPFMVNRLPPPTHAMVGLTTLLGISDNALFEFHLENWLGTSSGGMATAPELQRWSGAPYLCLYGENDVDSACVQVTGKEGIAVKMPGGHHFGGGYADIAAQILSRLPEL